MKIAVYNYDDQLQADYQPCPVEINLKIKMLSNPWFEVLVQIN